MCDVSEVFRQHGVGIDHAKRRFDLPAAAFGGGDGFAVFRVIQRAEADFPVAARLDDFDAVAGFEVVFRFDGGKSGRGVVGDDFADELLGGGVGGAAGVVLLCLDLPADEETVGVATVGESFQFAVERRVESAPGVGIVNRLAVELRGARRVVEGFGAPFDFQAIDADAHQFADVFDGAQVTAVHDVGAVFVFGDFHVFAGAVFFFEVVNAVGEGVALTRIGEPGERVRAEDEVGGGDEFALFFFRAAVGFVFPAAGVGAGALVGVAVVEVAGEQAAARVGHAQRAVDEDFQLHVGATLADFFDFFQREFAREDDAADTVVLPEFYGRPIDGVRLHGEVDGQVRVGVFHGHDESGVGHDKRVRGGGNGGREVAQGGVEFVVVRLGIDGEVEVFAECVRLADAVFQVVVGEFVAAHAQGVARRTRIDGIRAVGESVAHGFHGAGGGKEFNVSHKYWFGMKNGRALYSGRALLWHNSARFGLCRSGLFYFLAGVFMEKRMNVESFNLDHTKVKAPYLRLADKKQGENGDVIFKYDLRICQPNKEHMEMPALHSLEHLMAELSRNHNAHVVDISPMGCQTGFYVSLLNEPDYQTALNLIEETLKDVLNATEVPACNEMQCGWAASHSLEGAKALAQKLLDKRGEWETIFA